jgi:hypothetical protein
MEKIWSFTIQLGFNMWRDADSTPENDGPFQCQSTGHYQTKMLTERDTWRRVVDQLPSFGINTLVVDLGEGVQYKSHPELAVDGAWTVEELKEELARARALGLEVIPKLNFSSYHDAWLTPYCAQKGTAAYDKVVADLIDEACAIFDSPRFVHLGMDEEEFPSFNCQIFIQKFILQIQLDIVAFRETQIHELVSRAVTSVVMQPVHQVVCHVNRVVVPFCVDQFLTVSGQPYIVVAEDQVHVVMSHDLLQKGNRLSAAVTDIPVDPQSIVIAEIDQLEHLIKFIFAAMNITNYIC